MISNQPDPNDPNQQDPNGGCGSETWEGRCEGNTLVFCGEDQVERYDCVVCGYFPDEGYFDCYE